MDKDTLQVISNLINIGKIDDALAIMDKEASPDPLDLEASAYRDTLMKAATHGTESVLRAIRADHLVTLPSDIREVESAVFQNLYTFLQSYVKNVLKM